MGERLVIAVVLVAVAVVVAAVLERRRRPAAPTQSRRASVPTQLDRRDFDGADRPWLVAVFTSDTCDSCLEVLPKARALDSPEVAVVEVSYQARRDLHDRYAVDHVPTVVLADAQGVVRTSFVGSPPTSDLWAAMAEARDSPPPSD